MVVMDVATGSDNDAPIRAGLYLSAALDMNRAQADVRETNTSADIRVGIVGAAVADGIRHPAQRLLCDGAPREPSDSREPTHCEDPVSSWTLPSSRSFSVMAWESSRVKLTRAGYFQRTRMQVRRLAVSSGMSNDYSRKPFAIRRLRSAGLQRNAARLASSVAGPRQSSATCIALGKRSASSVHAGRRVGSQMALCCRRNSFIHARNPAYTQATEKANNASKRLTRAARCARCQTSAAMRTPRTATPSNIAPSAELSESIASPMNANGMNK